MKLSLIAFLLLSSSIFYSCKKTVACDNFPNVSYTTDIKAIMDRSCASAGCHDATTADAGIDLSTYALTKAEAGKSAFLESIKHKNGVAAMPEGASKLPTDEINKIECWITNGFTE